MKPSEIIKNLLEKGETVYSCALGRIGQVKYVAEDGEVFINSIKGYTACTTFDRGDLVEVKKSLDERYDWQVINQGW